MKRFIITTAIVAFLMGSFAFTANAKEIKTDSNTIVTADEKTDWNQKISEYGDAVKSCVEAFEKSKNDKTVDYKKLLQKALEFQKPIQAAKEKGLLSRSQVKKFDDFTKKLSVVPGAVPANPTARVNSSTPSATRTATASSSSGDNKVTGAESRANTSKEYKFNPKTAVKDFENAVNACTKAYKNSANAESISDNVKQLYNYAKLVEKTIKMPANWKQLNQPQQDDIDKLITQLGMIPIK